MKIRMEIVSAVLLGILGVSTIILELIYLDNNSTKLENTLFGVLEFVFSVAFAWMLARSSSRREFEQSQKSFAVAAFRRIKEIERTIGRLLNRTEVKLNEATGELRYELDVIHEITLGAYDTTKSSIGDWSDIIGDEISKIEKLEELRRKENELLEESGPSSATNEENSNNEKASQIAVLEQTQKNLLNPSQLI